MEISELGPDLGLVSTRIVSVRYPLIRFVELAVHPAPGAEHGEHQCCDKQYDCADDAIADFMTTAAYRYGAVVPGRHSYHGRSGGGGGANDG